MTTRTTEYKFTDNIIKTDFVKWSELVPLQPSEFKKQNKKQLDALKESLKNNGFKSPFYVWENNGKIYTLDGHTRIPALKLLIDDGVNIPEFLPAVFIKCKDKKDAKKSLLIYNSHYADIQQSELFEFVSDLNLEEINLEISIPTVDINKIVSDVLEDKDMFLENTGEIEGAFQLKNFIKFKSDNYYNIPELLSDKCLKKIDIETKTYTKNKYDEHCEYLYIWGSDSLAPVKNYEKITFAFYCDDIRFERLWNEPAKYVGKMLNCGVKKAIMPNFSIWTDSARAIQIMNRYRSMWLARYMQEAGIEIIPDINFGDEKSYEFCFMGLPHKMELASIQVQNLRGEDESIKNFENGLKYLMNNFDIEKLIVYGNKNKNEYIEEISFSLPSIIYIDSFTQEKFSK